MIQMSSKCVNDTAQVRTGFGSHGASGEGASGEGASGEGVAERTAATKLHNRILMTS
jgi:hypothetical protein